ncbi:MAG TPA: hypothetical protein VG860_13840 [Terriglobia bacterium]|jgi:hypothetical protein|nr:hypothetical protein [Terriglobia bacterium]
MSLTPTTGLEAVAARIAAGEPQLNEPRYEAAFFYALFLRGYPLERLREDIDVSPKVLERWRRLAAGDPWYRETVERMLNYRKEVLAIFDSLVLRELPTSASTH